MQKKTIALILIVIFITVLVVDSFREEDTGPDQFGRRTDEEEFEIKRPSNTTENMGRGDEDY